jgi:tetratricopeptide (TPR) repeat protein
MRALVWPWLSSVILVLFVGQVSVAIVSDEPLSECGGQSLGQLTGHYLRGLTNYRLGSFPQAVDDLSLALQECPTNEWVMYYLVRAQLGNKNYQKAEELGRILVRQKPAFARGYFVLGYSYFELHQWSMAAEQLQTAVRLEPEFWESHLLLGSALVLLNRKREAEGEFREAVILNPGSPDSHYYLGRLLFTRNRFPEALTEFSSMLELDPNSAKAYDNLGATHVAMGHFDVAALDFQRAIQLGKETGVPSEWPYINLGKLNYDTGEAESSRPLFLEAVRINPKNDVGFFWLGKTRFAMGQFEEARESLEKAISIYGENSDYHYFLSKIYQKLGKNEEARASLARFLELQKKH